MQLFILIGPSAAGKTTVMEALLADPTLNLVRFLTTTSRDPREGEIPGVQYQFVSPAQFRLMIKAGTFFEWTEIYGHLYGTNKETLNTLRQGARPIVCVLEPSGAQKIKQADPEQTTLIAIDAPRKTLLTRLQTRHTDPEDVAKRIARIDTEMRLYPKLADVCVTNKDGELAKTVEEVKQLILKTCVFRLF